MCNWADNKRTLGDVYSDFGNLRLTDVLPLRHTRDLGKVYTEFGNHRLIYIKDRCVLIPQPDSGTDPGPRTRRGNAN